MSPFVSMTMLHVSPVALGPVIFSTDTTLPLKGFLGLKVLSGRSPSSSSSGTFCRGRVSVAAAARAACRCARTACSLAARRGVPAAKCCGAEGTKGHSSRLKPAYKFRWARCSTRFQPASAWATAATSVGAAAATAEEMRENQAVQFMLA